MSFSNPRNGSLDFAIADSWEEHWKLIENGLLDPDQPTLHAHLIDLQRRSSLADKGEA